MQRQQKKLFAQASIAATATTLVLVCDSFLPIPLQASARQTSRTHARALLAPSLEIFSDTICPRAYLADEKYRSACNMISAAHPGFGHPKWTSMALRPCLLQAEIDEMQNVKQSPQTRREYGLQGGFGAHDLATPTVDSHRLLNFIAAVVGQEAALSCRREMMRLFNVEGKALSDREVLMEAVKEVGGDIEIAANILDSAAYRMDVLWMSQEARSSGIDKVPHYRFYTPEGVHSIVDFFDEWNFLDAIYLSFPRQPWSDWEEASTKARRAAAATTVWHSAKQAHREDGSLSAEEEIENAANEMTQARREYVDAFLSDPSTTASTTQSS
eukprot:TRINITY_DN61558_c0_g1_i1.p1 TRINITY_DN61558_c0_g1~~TRINITY_DN61558_c0_g1_i1.p1  ORF type:complete len:328 (-),score=54.31 TRINITY_DN61558_c0_g1_i1:405-1388(-)